MRIRSNPKRLAWYIHYISMSCRSMSCRIPVFQVEPETLSLSE